jgi:hypothetical protein
MPRRRSRHLADIARSDAAIRGRGRQRFDRTFMCDSRDTDQVRWAIVIVLIGCSYDPSRTGDPPGTIIRRLDTAAELAGEGERLATLSQTFVSGANGTPGPGTIEPVAFAIGALHARGINARLFTLPTDGSWSQLDSATVAGRALLQPTFESGSSGIPPGLGLASTSNFCIFSDGEIFLEAGEHRFEIRVDHDAFLEIAQQGSFARVVDAHFDTGNPPDVGTVTIAEAGWHPLRIAMCQDNGDAGLEIEHEPPGGNLDPLEARRLRAPIHALAGDHVIGFNHPFLTLPDDLASTVDAAQPFQEIWSATSSAVGPTESVRMTGQFRIDRDGTIVQLDVNAMLEHRLWLDGELVSPTTTWQTGTQQPTASSTTRTLTAGWHDLALDASPDGARNGMVSTTIAVDGASPTSIPAALVRPVASRKRTAGLRLPFTGNVSSSGSVTASADLVIENPGEPLAVVTDVDVVWAMSSNDWSEFFVELVTPSGAIVQLHDGSSASGGFTVFRWVQNVQLPANEPLSGTWGLRLRPTGGGFTNVTRNFAALTLHYEAGPDTYPRSSSYISPLLDLEVEASPTSLEATSIVIPEGSAVTTSVRTCDETGTACGEWFTSIDVANGVAERGRFAQIRVELTTDGRDAPLVDAVELRALP